MLPAPSDADAGAYREFREHASPAPRPSVWVVGARRSVGALLLVGAAAILVWTIQTISPTTIAFVIQTQLRLNGHQQSHLRSPSASTDQHLWAQHDPVVHDVAHVVIIRHGEKDQGTGLSEVGAARAKYLARCMSFNHSSTALPHGPPTYIMASHGHPGK